MWWLMGGMVLMLAVCATLKGNSGWRDHWGVLASGF